MNPSLLCKKCKRWFKKKIGLNILMPSVAKQTKSSSKDSPSSNKNSASTVLESLSTSSNKKNWWTNSIQVS
jgi:hypothetical protein